MIHDCIHFQILAEGEECLRESEIYGISRLEVNGYNSLDSSVIMSNSDNMNAPNAFVAIVNGM